MKSQDEAHTEKMETAETVVARQPPAEPEKRVEYLEIWNVLKLGHINTERVRLDPLSS